MEPIVIKKAGRELGNAAAAARICVDPATGKAIHFETYQWYVRVGKPAGNKAPAHVEIDNKTGQRMYPLKDVREWQRKRKGRGNWGGVGARARLRVIGSAECPVCSRTVDVNEREQFVDHPAPGVEPVGGKFTVRCAQSGERPTRYTLTDEPGKTVEPVEPDGSVAAEIV